jgi:hypothetical protein
MAIAKSPSRRPGRPWKGFGKIKEKTWKSAERSRKKERSKS